MQSQDYLSYIADIIHTTIVATVDDENLPVTAAIDMMDSDENSLYFLTARGKGFYDRLKKRGFLALTAMKGEDTMHSVAVSLRGKVRELGPELLPQLFTKNPYMAEIYPTESSRSALTVFQIYEGTGEWFDLSQKPIHRDSFAFGQPDNAPELQSGYRITDACIGCGTCVAVCPQNCIQSGSIPFVIDPHHCLHCGNCFRDCPAGAVEKLGGISHDANRIAGTAPEPA